MSVLTPQQITQFHNLGYLQVSGLIPPDIAGRAADAYRALRQSAPEPPNKFGAAHKGYDDPDLMAAYTPGVLGAVADLIDKPVAEIAMPTTAYTITMPPAVPGSVSLQPHVDRMEKGTADPGFRVLAMTYLSDFGADGGGTVIWPGSPALVRGLLETAGNGFDTLDDIKAGIEEGRIALGEPLCATAQRGDAMFIDALMVHSGGTNTSPNERYALNWKW